MSDAILTNTQADLNGKTALVAETSASITGGLIPASDAVQVGVLRKAVVTLTNAQIKALPTSGIQIVAAPGAGFWVHPLSVSYSMNFVADYTNIDATYAELALVLGSVTATDPWIAGGVANDSTSTPALTNLTNWLATGVRLIAGIVPYATSIVGGGGNAGYVQSIVNLTADMVNKALSVAIENNGAGNLTGGDAANTLKVTVTYVVEAS